MHVIVAVTPKDCISCFHTSEIFAKKWFLSYSQRGNKQEFIDCKDRTMISIHADDGGIQDFVRGGGVSRRGFTKRTLQKASKMCSYAFSLCFYKLDKHLEEGSNPLTPPLSMILMLIIPLGTA